MGTQPPSLPAPERQAGPAGRLADVASRPVRRFLSRRAAVGTMRSRAWVCEPIRGPAQTSQVELE